MTGQVKETILARMGELGVRVEDGSVRFEPTLLSRDDFVEEPTTWRFLRGDGSVDSVVLQPGSLGFTMWGVPTIYRLTDGEAAVSLVGADGGVVDTGGTRLGTEVARHLFSRDGTIQRLDVEVPRANVMASPG